MARDLTLSTDEYRIEARGKGDLSDWDAVVREDRAGPSSLLGPILLGLATLILGVGGFLLTAVV